MSASCRRYEQQEFQDKGRGTARDLRKFFAPQCWRRLQIGSDGAIHRVCLQNVEVEHV